jgi:hypothetical protein
MIMTTTLTRPMYARHVAANATLIERLSAWFQRGAAADAVHHTRDSAAKLYARAAHYERTQPGFAADLRAAAEAMDRLAAKAAR